MISKLNLLPSSILPAAGYWQHFCCWSCQWSLSPLLPAGRQLSQVSNRLQNLTAKRTQDGVFCHIDLQNLGFCGSDGPQKDTFFKPLVFTEQKWTDQYNHTCKQTEYRHKSYDKCHFLKDVIDWFKDSSEIDYWYIGKSFYHFSSICRDGFIVRCFGDQYLKLWCLL